MFRKFLQFLDPLFICAKFRLFSLTVLRGTAISTLVWLVPPGVTFADDDREFDDGSRIFRIEAIPATGGNDQCGAHIWILPGLGDVHFTFVGEYDPSPEAQDSIPITPDNCRDDIILATTTDQAFLSLTEFPDANFRLKNLPLRKVPVIVSPDGMRASIPPGGVLPPNPLPPVKSEPNTDITLGDWLSARGSMTIRCFADGTARVKARFRKLVPNGVYTMWAVWLTTLPGASSPTLLPLPFAGVPNAVVPDSRGRANFKRDLFSCPQDGAPGSVMLTISLTYHSDGSIYGAVPDLPLATQDYELSNVNFLSTIPAGIVTHDQLLFPISVSSAFEENDEWSNLRKRR